MHRLRRVPAPLLALLAATVVCGLSWTLAIPALQGPDESSHIAYVQRIADAHQIPWGGHAEILEASFGPSVSSEQRTAWVWAGLEPLRGNTAAVPLWTAADEAIYLRRARQGASSVRTDGAGSPSYRNPPLAYLYSAIPYALASRGSYFDRVYLMRVANIPLLLAAVLFTWLLAGELFGRARGRQTVAAAAVAMHPVLTDTVSKVSPDAMLIAASAAALYCCARLVRVGLTPASLLCLIGACAFAGLSQGRGLAIALPAIAAVLVAVWPGPLARVSRRRRSAVAVAGAAVVVLVIVVVAARGSVSAMAGFGSYLWQFYLPALPGMSPPPGLPWGVHQVFLERFFATYGQFEVSLPSSLTSLLRGVLLAGLMLAGAALIHHRAALRARAGLAIVLTTAIAGTLLFLHAGAYRSLLVNPADPVITGRYLLAVIPLYGIGVAGALTVLPRRLEGAGAGAVLAGVAILQVSALGHVVERFYA